MTAAAVTPAAPMPARTFPNRYACTCDTCQSAVPRGEGSVRRATRKDREVRAAGRRWFVTCASCAACKTCDGYGMHAGYRCTTCTPFVDTCAPIVAAPVVEPAPVPRKTVKRATPTVSDGYTLTSAGVIRCVGCGMLKGGGHYQGCNRPTLKRDGWLKPAVKPGTAAHAKLQASVVKRLATIETDDRGYIRAFGKGC